MYEKSPGFFVWVRELSKVEPCGGLWIACRGVPGIGHPSHCEWGYGDGGERCLGQGAGWFIVVGFAEMGFGLGDLKCLEGRGDGRGTVGGWSA